MKRIILFACLFIVPAIASAQPYALKEKKGIAAKVDSLLHQYLHKSSLAEQNGNKPNIKIIKDLKNLFLPGALIFDDINAEYHDDGKGYPYKLKEKSRDDYFDGLIEQFPARLNVVNKRMAINYDSLDNGKVQAILERNIAGTRSSGKYSLVNDDTLLITIRVQPDRTVKISGITSMGSTIRVMNDKDLDGIIDTEDQCPDQKGMKNTMGCPDRDNDNIPDKDDVCPDQPGTVTNKGCPASDFAYRFVVEGGTGYFLSRNKMARPEAADLGYNNSLLDKNRSSMSLENPSMKGSIGLWAGLAYYSGKQKHKINRGVSVGFFYTRYQATYGVSGSKLVFQGFDDPTINPEGYRRIISLRDFSERNTFTVLQIPVQYRLRGKLNAKWSMEAGFGPAFSIIRTKTQQINSMTYVEGYQQIDSISFQPYYDPRKNPQFSDVPIIYDSISGNFGVVNPGNLFDLLHERVPLYDFGERKGGHSGNSKVKSQTGISIHVNAGLAWHVMPKTAIRAGLTLVYAPAALRTGGKAAKNYHADNEQTPDQYNSVFNSGAKANYLSFGFNLGILFGISSK